MPQPPAAHTTPHAGGLARTPVVRPLVPSPPNPLPLVPPPHPPAAPPPPHAGGLARTPVVRPLVPSLASAVLLAALAPAGAALAQTMPAATGADSSAWRRCSALSGNDPARLACFDAWAAQQ